MTEFFEGSNEVATSPLMVILQDERMPVEQKHKLILEAVRDVEVKVYNEYENKVDNIKNYIVDKVNEFMSIQQETIIKAIKEGDQETLQEIRKQAHAVVTGYNTRNQFKD